MKKVLFILGLLSFSLSFMACGDDDDDNTISYDELPVPAKAFMTAHFANQTVSKVEKDNDSYDVYLPGYKIEFNLDGEWDSIDGKIGTQRNQIPSSVLALIPSKITTYVTSTYPQAFVMEVDKEKSYGYEITLNNDLELKFNHDGEFLGIDK